EEQTVETPIRKVRLVRSGEARHAEVLAELPEWEMVLGEGRETELVAGLSRRFPELSGAARIEPAYRQTVRRYSPTVESDEALFLNRREEGRLPVSKTRRTVEAALPPGQ